MKKFLCALCVVAFVFITGCAGPGTSSPPAGGTQSSAGSASTATVNFTYDTIDGLYTLVGTTTSAEVVEIPPIFEALGEFAVYNGAVPNIKTLILSANISKIDPCGIYQLSTLEEILVDEANPHFTSIDGVLFTKDGSTLVRYPEGLAGSYTVPDGVTTIAARAFDSAQLLTEINFPQSLVSVEEYAFIHCYALTRLDFPDGTTSIGPNAIGWCDELTEVTIPASLTDFTIGDPKDLAKGSLFSNCPKMANFRVAEGNPSFCDIDGVLFDAAGETLRYYPAGREGDYTAPESTRVVAARAFYMCEELTALTLPAGFESFASSESMMFCSNLKAIYFEGDAPEEVTLSRLESSSGPTIYHHADAEGWNSTWGGFRTAVY